MVTVNYHYFTGTNFTGTSSFCHNIVLVVIDDGWEMGLGGDGGGGCTGRVRGGDTHQINNFVSSRINHFKTVTNTDL